MSIFSHHAVILSGNTESNKRLLFSLLEKEGIKREQNPDIFVHTAETVSVEDARMLSERQLRKSAGVGKKIFIVEFSHMTHEAQNALLKVFEEPTQDTHFFLLTEHGHALLPTLQSRLSRFEIEGEETVLPYEKEAKAFLGQSISERIEFLAPYIEDKNKDMAIAFVSALEVALHKVFSKDLAPVKDFLKDLEQQRAYLHDRGSSVKLILEYIAHMCPSTK